MSNSIFFSSHVENYVLVTNEYFGDFKGNYTKSNISRTISTKFIDKNSYPMPKTDRILFTTLQFNYTEFKNYFKENEKIWFLIGVNFYFLPPTNQKEKFTFHESIMLNESFNTSAIDEWFFQPVFELIEQSVLPSLITFKIFHFIIIVLLILFCRVQPLKSRGVIPFLAFLYYFFSSFFSIYKFLPLEYYYLGCYFNYLGAVPLSLSSFILFIITYIRYVIFSNLNVRKENFSTKQKSSKRNNFKYMLITLKYFTHPIVSLLIWVISMSFFIILYFIFIMTLKCEKNLQGVDGYVSSIFYGIIIIIGVSFFILDFILNIRTIFSKCGICKLLWKKDPYSFRTELYIIGILNTIPMFIAYFIVIYLFESPVLVNSVVSFLLEFSVFMLQTGYVLLLTIISFIIGLFRKKPKGFLIEKLLGDEEFHSLFYEFAKSEWSTENLDCYDDIEEFEKNPTKENAQNLIVLYFNGRSSELEVNIPNHVTSNIKENINADAIDRLLFFEAKEGVILNMKDTFSRFIWTKEYKNFILKNEAFGDKVVEQSNKRFSLKK
eukprot:gene3622-6438_t